MRKARKQRKQRTGRKRNSNNNKYHVKIVINTADKQTYPYPYHLHQILGISGNQTHKRPESGITHENMQVNAQETGIKHPTREISLATTPEKDIETIIETVPYRDKNGIITGNLDILRSSDDLLKEGKMRVRYISNNGRVDAIKPLGIVRINQIKAKNAEFS